MPHPSVELSMTRHTQATPEEIWAEGTRVANLRSKTLYGRADVAARAITQQSLVIEAAPIPENPNHVNALHWPEDKAVQKIKALGRVD